MRFLMRHGADHESDSKEGGSLTSWGVEQVRNAAKTILASILNAKPPVQEVTILHTPMKRGEESAKIIQKELSDNVQIKEVKPDQFLKHREGLKVLDEVTQETISEFYLKNKPLEKEAHILISHANVLKQMAVWRAYKKKGLKSIKHVHEYYEHADVTDEYGKLLDTDDAHKK